MRILGISGSLRRESHNSMLLRAAIAEADAVLIATPEYNYSIPGVLKNAIDWASRPSASAVMRNKPAAVVGASTGMFGAVWSQAETRKSLAGAGARVIDRELPVAEAHSAFDEAGRLSTTSSRRCSARSSPSSVRRSRRGAMRSRPRRAQASRHERSDAHESGPARVERDHARRRAGRPGSTRGTS